MREDVSCQADAGLLEARAGGAEHPRRDHHHPPHRVRVLTWRTGPGIYSCAKIAELIHDL